MSNIELFVLTFVETSSAMVLWKSLDSKAKGKTLKSILIIILVSTFIVITEPIKSSISTILNYIFLISIVKLMFNKKLSEVFSEFCIVIVASIIIQLVLVSVISFLGYMPTNIKSFAGGIIINILFLIAASLVYIFIPVEEIFNKAKKVIIKMHLVLINLLAYILIVKLVWENNQRLILEQFLYFVIVPIIFIIANAIYFVYQYKLREQKKIIDIYNRYSVITSNLIKDVRRRQHDFKNHLGTIYGITQVTDKEFIKNEVENYINSLNYSFKDMELLIQINDNIIRAVVYSKLYESKNKDIDFVYEIDNSACKFPLMNFEISEILNNLLDNAIEAADNVNNIKKEIKLIIGKEEGRQLIEIKNTGEIINPENINKVFRKGFSTKKGKGRGFGLYNVKKIVESYKGEIQLSSTKSYTVIKILF